MAEKEPQLDEDRELVRRCRDGDEHAFERLVKKHQQTVFNAIYHTIGRRAEVEDIAQKIFTKVYFSLTRYDLGRPFLPWLYRIAINQCYDELRHLRRRRVRTFTELQLEDIEQIENLIGASDPAQASTDAHSQLYTMMHQVIEQLPKSQRTALVLRELQDVPYEQIAGIMECSEQAVRLKVMRGRSRLRQLMEKALRRRMLKLGQPQERGPSGTRTSGEKGRRDQEAKG